MPRIKTQPQRLATTDTRRVKPPPPTTEPYYRTQQHRDWAAGVIARSGGHCQGLDCDKPPDWHGRLYADHVDELKDQGDPLGLGVALCGSCHQRKTAVERGKRRQREDAAWKLAINSDQSIVAGNQWVKDRGSYSAAGISRDRGGDGQRGTAYPEWLRPSLVPVVLVCGPPAAGKTTYVAHNAGSSDLVIDFDEIAAALSGCPPHAYGDEWFDRALRRRNAMLSGLSRRVPWRRAWLTLQAPLADRRSWWCAKLRNASVVILATPEAECLRRVAQDPDRQLRLHRQIGAIRQWWDQYSPRPGERVLDATNDPDLANDPNSDDMQFGFA